MDASTTYLVQRMLADVRFLREQGHLNDEGARLITSKLDPLVPSSSRSGTDHASPAFSNLSLGSAAPSSVATAPSRVPSVPVAEPYRAPAPPSLTASNSFNRRVPPPSTFPSAPTQPSAFPSAPTQPSAFPSVPSHTPTPEPRKSKEYVKAMWDFDANGGDDELRFRTGDVIEIVDKADEHWWKGQIDGREGIFPSNYVQVTSDRPRHFPPKYDEKTPLSSDSEKRNWAPPSARWSSAGPPPAPVDNAYGYPAPQIQQQPPQQNYSYGYPAPVQGGVVSPSVPPPPPPGSSSSLPGGLQPAPVTEEEKKRHQQMRKYGGLLGKSMVGGFGFGVGSAIGHDLIN